jgi:hypothetical protein
MFAHRPLSPSGLALLLPFLAAFGTGMPVSAQMYKWIDEDGVTQYTQHPPPGDIRAEEIKPPPAVDPGEADRQIDRSRELAEEWSKARSERGEEQRKAGEDAAWYAENCRRAQASVNAYSVPNALVEMPDGSRDRLTEEARLAGLAEAEARVREYCR